MDEVFGLFPIPFMRAGDRPLFAEARRPALYLVGAVAAYWSWARVAAIFL
jgi:hypothetical protein